MKGAAADVLHIGNSAFSCLRRYFGRHKAATVKAEIDGLTPSLNRAVHPAEWGDKAGNPNLRLSAVKAIWGCPFSQN